MDTQRGERYTSNDMSVRERDALGQGWGCVSEKTPPSYTPQMAFLKADRMAARGSRGRLPHLSDLFLLLLPKH